MLRILICLCLLPALFACSSTSSSISSDLISVEWRVITMAGKAPNSKKGITLRVDRYGGVAGRGPVNSYKADSVVSPNGGWSFQNPSNTKRLGTPTEMDEEALFLRLMIRANKWRKRGNKLDLMEGKRVLMTFKRGPR